MATQYCAELCGGNSARMERAAQEDEHSARNKDAKKGHDTQEEITCNESRRLDSGRPYQRSRPHRNQTTPVSSSGPAAPTLPLNSPLPAPGTPRSHRSSARARGGSPAARNQ